ncbi:MAG: hypothetical protein ACT4RN_02910 [Pseudonocardia sp.]
MRSTVRAFVQLGVALSLVMGVPATALAVSSDAVGRCNATRVQEGVGADVGEADRFEYFASVSADDGSAEEILCGDGRTWGAVHIEVKHRVPGWGLAKDCMRKVMSRSRAGDENGKRVWIYSWAPGRSARVVAGNNGMITSYPWDGGSEGSWSECARS